MNEWHQRRWSLGRGTVAVIALPNRLTLEHVARLKRYAAVLEAEASIANDDEFSDEDEADVRAYAAQGGAQ